MRVSFLLSIGDQIVGASALFLFGFLTCCKLVNFCQDIFQRISSSDNLEGRIKIKDYSNFERKFYFAKQYGKSLKSLAQTALLEARGARLVFRFAYVVLIHSSIQSTF